MILRSRCSLNQRSWTRGWLNGRKYLRPIATKRPRQRREGLRPLALSLGVPEDLIRRLWPTDPERGKPGAALALAKVDHLGLNDTQRRRVAVAVDVAKAGCLWILRRSSPRIAQISPRTQWLRASLRASRPEGQSSTVSVPTPAWSRWWLTPSALRPKVTADIGPRLRNRDCCKDGYHPLGRITQDQGVWPPAGDANLHGRAYGPTSLLGRVCT